jgi:quinolinate synthase
MYETIYLLLATIGGVSLALAMAGYRYHNEEEVFAAIAFVAWTVVALASDTIVALDETGATHTFGSGAMQLVAAMLALVSAVAVIGKLTDKWPDTGGELT